MRFGVAIVVCGLAATSRAGEATGRNETLVGWSADGARYAIVGFDTSEVDTGYFLEVREGDTVVARWNAKDKGVPAAVDNTPGVERIDIETWGPIKRYHLKKIEPAARTRFAAALVLESTSVHLPDDKYNCRRGGAWSLSVASDHKVVQETQSASGHCFELAGGYLDAAGTRVLVKLTETWATHSPETISHAETRFLMIPLRP